MRFNQCGIIRICLRRREGYLFTTTITITSKLKEFKVARVVLQKINVADEICLLVFSKLAGWPGWPGWLVSMVEGGCVVGC